MALGADRMSVVRLILRQGVVLALAGLALGLAGAIAATRLLETVLFEVRPNRRPGLCGGRRLDRGRHIACRLSSGVACGRSESRRRAQSGVSMKLKWPFISQKRDDEMIGRDGVSHRLENARARRRRNDRGRTRGSRRGGGSEACSNRRSRATKFAPAASSKPSCATHRHMGRGLRRTPGFTIAVVLTLALGIGANTAIFSVVDQVLLRPLPYPDGDNLVMVYEPGAATVTTRSRRRTGSIGSATTERSNGFAAWTAGRSAILTGAGEATRSELQAVSSEFFPVLGVGPALGRPINEDDDRPNAPNSRRSSALVSWQTPVRRRSEYRRAFYRARTIDPHQVVGVMPPGFRFVYRRR